MTAVGAAHGGDVRGMAGSGQPIVNRCSDAPALDRGLARPMMARDQEQHPLTASDGLFEAAIDRRPSAVEVHAVKVQDSVRLDRAAAQPFVPVSVERLRADRRGPRPG